MATDHKSMLSKVGNGVCLSTMGHEANKLSGRRLKGYLVKNATIVLIHVT